MTMQFISDLIDKKIDENPNFIRFTFYELRVKENLSEGDTDTLLSLAAQRLENNRYLIYKTGDTYTLNGEQKKVESNELLIAIK